MIITLFFVVFTMALQLFERQRCKEAFERRIRTLVEGERNNLIVRDGKVLMFELRSASRFLTTSKYSQCALEPSPDDFLTWKWPVPEAF